MDELEKELLGGIKRNDLTIRENFNKYLSYIPLFIVSLIICISVGIMYTRYTTPKYNVSALILVKGDEKEVPQKGSSSEDLISTVLNGEAQVNLDNQIQLIRSTGLMEKVVSKYHFNISYFNVGKVHNTDIYLDAPFRLIQQDNFSSDTPITITIRNFNNDSITLEYGLEKDKKTSVVKWNTTFKIGGNLFFLAPKGKVLLSHDSYEVILKSVKQTAENILDNLSADILDKKTTIIHLEILIENIKRGEDILNALANEYKIADIEEKNVVTQNTYRFIEDRLGIVSQELRGVEGNLEDYRGTNQIIDVESQSSQSLENSNNVSKDINDINIQQGVVNMIQDYFNNSNNITELVPSSLGINDATLASLIVKYNELQLKKQREAPLLAPNSLVLQDLSNQINDVKGNILENLQNIKKNLKLKETSLQEKNVQYRQLLTAMPHKERVMQEIKRKQSITEGLYLYLLQKREEAAISLSSSNVSNFKQIDIAKGNPVPVEPKPRVVRILSVIIGFLLPMGLIRLKNLLNDKVSATEDVTNKFQIPIIGELEHISRLDADNALVIKDDIMGEKFRIIRTNISLFLKKKQNQVILITSTISGEGKSLLSVNLAAIMAIPGKKVALLEFDFRQPGLISALQIKNNLKGLANYLNGDVTSLSEISLALNNIPTLDLFASGKVMQNPGDLLLTDNLTKLFDDLKRKYDYIIIDSSSVDLSSDTFILSEYSDSVIYVIRRGFTLKKHLNLINDFWVTGKLNNLSLMINDV